MQIMHIYTQVLQWKNTQTEPQEKVNHPRHTHTHTSSSLIFPCHYTPFPSHPQTTPEQSKRSGLHHKTPKTVTWAPENNEEKLKQEEENMTQEVLEQRKLKMLQKAGIKVLPAAVRYSRSERRGHEAAAAVV